MLNIYVFMYINIFNINSDAELTLLIIGNTKPQYVFLCYCVCKFICNVHSTISASTILIQNALNILVAFDVY